MKTATTDEVVHRAVIQMLPAGIDWHITRLPDDTERVTCSHKIDHQPDHATTFDLLPSYYFDLTIAPESIKVAMVGQCPVCSKVGFAVTADDETLQKVAERLMALSDPSRALLGD